MNYTCPVCGHLTFKEPPGSYDICTVCGWEDDLSQLRFPESLGANDTSLIEAQKIVKNRGYFKRSIGKLFTGNKEKPEKDPSWRPLLDGEEYEHQKSGVDYGDTYPKDLTELYYWKKYESKN